MSDWLSNIDPVLAGLVLFVFAMGVLAGWAICQLTHKQKGIEVDRPVTDVLPMPPPPVVVPDTVPDEWTDSEEVR